MVSPSHASRNDACISRAAHGRAARCRQGLRTRATLRSPSNPLRAPTCDARLSSERRAPAAAQLTVVRTSRSVLEGDGIDPWVCVPPVGFKPLRVGLNGSSEKGRGIRTVSPRFPSVLVDPAQKPVSLTACAVLFDYARSTASASESVRPCSGQTRAAPEPLAFAEGQDP